MINFKNIDYLKSGNIRQKRAFLELKELQIFELLQKYNPILVGTIPIQIDLPNSDLDIVCNCQNHKEFSTFLISTFSNQKDFQIEEFTYSGVRSTIAKFQGQDFEIEIFGQNIPSLKQNAYRHMIIEYNILEERGGGFRDQILALKTNGYNTEAAFAKLLNLKGDPFKILLELERP